MAQQKLTTQIVLNGKVGSGINEMGQALTTLGSQLDGIAGKIREIGLEGLYEYADYDDTMRMVQELGKHSDETMEALDAYNKSIAQTSRYTREQAAEAELLMGKLGLGLEDTQTLMPTVMNMATAANIDLADSLDYLYYSLRALDQPMSYATTLSDQMAKAADISAADIDGLGLSLQRLGSGAKFFAGGSSEMLAIFAALSEYGEDMQDTSAGTQLRNFMLTLLAPTTSKKKLLESFGVSDKEWAEFETYMEDAGINVTETADAMNKLGLSVYDAATGELKPAIQIIAELEAALASMSEEEKNATLGQLFGKRTTIVASNLLESLETIIKYQGILLGESEGYTDNLAEAADGGIGGAIRELTAAWSDLKLTVGEAIAPEGETIIDLLHRGVSAVSNFDPVLMEGLTTGLGTIAGLSVGLGAAGAAMSAIGAVLSPGGIALTSVAAAVGVAAALAKLEEIDFESGFGIMELDEETLGAHLQAISDEFTSSYTEVNAFKDALDGAVESYEAASVSLSGKLLTNAITGTTLTTEEMNALSGLGTTMGNSVLDGIKASFDSSSAYLAMLGGEDAVSSEAFGSAFVLLGQMQEQMLLEAEQLGKEFGSTLGSAMDDGVITGDEYTVIMKKMQEYNDAMAFVAEADKAGEHAKQLHKAQSVSWDSASGFLAEQAAIMDADIAEAEMAHVEERAEMGVYYDKAIQQGWINPLTGAAYTEADKNKFLDDMDLQYQHKIQSYKDDNAEVVMAVYDALMSQSGYGDAWQFLSQLYTSGDLKRDEYGYVTRDAMDWASLFPEGMPLYGEDNPIADQLHDLWRGEHGFLGIGNELSKILEPYMDSEFIALIPQMLDDASTIANYLYAHSAESGREDLVFGTTADSGIGELLNAMEQGIAAGDYSAIGAAWNALSDMGVEKYSRIMSSLQNAYDFERVLADMGGVMSDINNPYRNQIAAYQLMYGDIDAEEYLITAQVDPVLPEGADATLSESAVAMMEAAQEALNTGLTAPVEVMSMEESAKLKIDLAQDFLDQNPGKWRVRAYFGGAGGLASTVAMFAEGGRATEASIFGEAGAEWAIPEEHTANTANLIWRAAQASGFTWDDIGAANGVTGRNSSGGNTLIYSPTIIAADARGVAEKLKEDKEELERWLKERELKDRIAVYA